MSAEVTGADRGNADNAVNSDVGGGRATGVVETPYETELTEAVTAASLQHPNIVAVHEVGAAEGQHYFVMDYVPGPTLADMTRNGPLPVKQAAEYVRTIAGAVHFAHERGILHRDAH